MKLPAAVIFLAALSCSSALMAQEAPVSAPAAVAVSSAPVPSSGTFSVITGYSVNLAGMVRGELATRMLSASQRLDKLLGGKYHSADNENLTGGDLRLELQLVEAGVAFSPNFSLHFDLPGASQRLNLIVEHVNQQFLEEKAAPQSLQEQQSRIMNGQTQDGTMVGFRFFPSLNRRFRQHVDVGTSYSPFPNPFRVPKPFVRVNFAGLYELGDWDGRWQAQGAWRGEAKIEYFLNFNEVRYLVPDKLSFGVASSFHYISNDPSVDFVQSFSLPWQINSRDALTPAFYFSASSWPAIIITGYSTGVTYRRDLAGGKWLYFDITPSVDYMSSRAYHPFYRLTTAIQIYFGASRD